MALTIKQFWRLTPYEFNLYVQGYDDTIKAKRSLVWDAANLQRCDPKRFPNKRRFVEDTVAPKPHTLTGEELKKHKETWVEETFTMKKK